MIKLDHEQFLSAEVQSRPRAEDERLDRSKYREYSRRFVLCCFVITIKWSLLKQQDFGYRHYYKSFYVVHVY